MGSERVAGLYYLEADSFITSGPIQPFTVNHEAEVRRYMAINHDFANDWSVTLGARYTDEDKQWSLFVASGGRRCGSNYNNTDPSALDVCNTLLFR